MLENKGTHDNEVPQRRLISTTSTPLSLGDVENRIGNSIIHVNIN